MLTVLALGLAAGIAQSSTETRNVPAATLDVVVEDSRGKPVDTLGPADFVVTERNRTLTVEGVRFVRTAGPVPTPSNEQPSGSETIRLFAIFLDEFHVAAGPGADRVRDALVRFVNEDLQPGDQIVVLKPLDSLLDIRLTSDRASAVRLIQSFNPRRGDYTPQTAFERNYIAGAPPRIEMTRSQIATSSLDALAAYLGRFNAERKTLIVVSEGFTKTVHRRGDELLPSIDSVVLAANRAHVAIYPIEPSSDAKEAEVDGSGREAARPALQAALRSLAEGTTGRAIVPTDDVTSGLKRALSDASGYYVLTVSDPERARDGRYHPVDVSVRRQGLTLRARRGYWAPSDDDLASHTSLIGARADLFAQKIARRSSPLIRPWFGMAPDDSGNTRVTFVWEPAPRVPGERTQPPIPVRVQLSVATLDGTPVFEGVVFPSNEASALAPAGASRQSQASFVSPARRLLVQIAIEDATSREVDRDVRDLVVGGFKGPVTIGTSEVMRARSARDYHALASDPEAVPVATRQFSRGDRLLIRVPVFSESDAPTVTARLLSGLGGAMRDVAVDRAPSSAEYQIDLPLAGLATGVYTIEISATCPHGNARDGVTFRVTP